MLEHVFDKVEMRAPIVKTRVDVCKTDIDQCLCPIDMGGGNNRLHGELHGLAKLAIEPRLIQLIELQF
jgi:hypothetical protein